MTLLLDAIATRTRVERILLAHYPTLRERIETSAVLFVTSDFAHYVDAMAHQWPEDLQEISFPSVDEVRWPFPTQGVLLVFEQAQSIGFVIDHVGMESVEPFMDYEEAIALWLAAPDDPDLGITVKNAAWIHSDSSLTTGSLVWRRGPWSGVVTEVPRPDLGANVAHYEAEEVDHLEVLHQWQHDSQRTGPLPPPPRLRAEEVAGFGQPEPQPSWTRDEFGARHVRDEGDQPGEPLQRGSRQILDAREGKLITIPLDRATQLPDGSWEIPADALPADQQLFSAARARPGLTISHSTRYLRSMAEAVGHRLASIEEPDLSREPRGLRRQVARAKPFRVLRLASPDRPARVKDEAAKVEWSKRWGVRGHWRAQWYGRRDGHREQRTIWIDPYLKGPEDKPLDLRPDVFER